MEQWDPDRHFPAQGHRQPSLDKGEPQTITPQSSGANQGLVGELEQYDNLLRMNKLESDVREIQEKFQRLEGSYAPIEGTEVRDIAYEEAKKLIAEYFEQHHGEEIDAVDLQEALGIHVLTVAQVCEELEREGKIRST